MNKAERQPAKIFALLSLILPGLGQALQRDWKRGFSIFLAIATAMATVVWYGKSGWYIAIILLWLWNVWDALNMPRGAPVAIAVLLWLGMAYGIGWQVTQVNPMALFTNTERAQSILRPMLQPDFFTARKEKHEGWVEIQVPCSATPPKAEKTVGDIHIRVQPDCGNLNETLIVTADGLWPNEPTEITWMTPIGDVKLLGPGNNQMLVVETDDEGHLSAVIQVPGSALAAAPDPTLPLPHRVYLTQTRPIGGMTLSTNGQYVVRGIYETLALALLSTLLGAILAIPLGFLAARNLMSGHPILMGIYVIVRTILNIVRSIESLILAIIFVIIVGLGPFPGMLALAIHTTAALGKLYSEVIEAIDPGPIEAIRATGANNLQVIRYAVIPQIIPPFTALTIYRWDINVRSSTIIGFVGGGGIGFFLYQWILIGDFRAVSASFIAIAAVVMILDFFSAKLRERLV
ncbi:phosphonate ABC transporter, permease protein PhnE [Thermanaerothrix daxensis]|uniref:phosphonate ABC transporter, permease protein PhnE n=1 Tax=Thermanaerothrix daxensis TaxID=869279 RepID=UPI0006C936F9|nr:phosphonate ABC transporter, permease protein PhnE [Thermanaerothrix daxensis]